MKKSINQALFCRPQPGSVKTKPTQQVMRPLLKVTSDLRLKTCFCNGRKQMIGAQGMFIPRQLAVFKKAAVTFFRFYF